MSWHLLQRFIESDVFNQNPFLSVSYLSRYADHVGIHYVLCSKLRQFPYEDIEFFLPQLCHLIISLDNESMALEEFLLDLCEESVTAALLTFWLFQTYLHGFSSNPSAQAFKTCRRVYNKVQHIVFGLPDAARHEKIKENILPVTVLASFVLASVGVPILPHWAGPLAVAQARRTPPDGDVVPENNQFLSDGSQTVKIARSQTVTGGTTKSKRRAEANGPNRVMSMPVRSPSSSSTSPSDSRGAVDIAVATTTTKTTSYSDSARSSPRLEALRRGADSPSLMAMSQSTVVSASQSPVEGRKAQQHEDAADDNNDNNNNSNIHISVNGTGNGNGSVNGNGSGNGSGNGNGNGNGKYVDGKYIEGKLAEARLSSSSLPLPDVRSPKIITRPPTPLSAGFTRQGDTLTRRHSHHTKTFLSKLDMSSMQKCRLLRQNYFRCETAFLTALESISNRLVMVPKQARLSALRAELALIARDLPAELDIPIICPPTLVQGSPSKSKHHRIVRINPAEATVLNSAEKVPYLLMVEILRDDFNFDPDSADNQTLLGSLLTDQGSRKRIFDLSDAPRTAMHDRVMEPVVPENIDSVFEPQSGDLGHSPMLKPFDDDTNAGNKKNGKLPNSITRLPSGSTTLSSLSELATPRTSDPSTSRSSSPGGLRRMTITNPRNNSVEQPDFSALATHMRTASQMLAQLEATGGKRPKSEVAAIRAKIIASMQSLEEQNFDDGQGPTFDMIIAKARMEDRVDNNEVDPDMEPAMNESAGQARMENDAMTGGVQRRGDRDDPSAAVFGEAWQQKKERIRKSSPYGWMKNWDLVSVIVKTGADLRQEAFACQLIQCCDKIWRDANVSVWVKLMRILVTGESSGLIETITNGVSLHSLKRSLTMSSIDAGLNPRRRIATLKDHFVKTFGVPESEPYRAAVDAFKRSLAAYSVISYVFQLKDRHNGNVLVDNEGHIIHIDFGFMLSNSPGSVGFEAAPFKLTYEYVEVMGGTGSPDFEDYKRLCKQAFQALRRSAENIIDLVSITGRDSKMPCFAVGVAQATNTLRQRFQLHLSADEAESFVDTDLIAKSLGSYYTRLYDTFQYRTQGIY